MSVSTYVEFRFSLTKERHKWCE